LLEFPQIHSFDTVGYKDELIDFEVKRSKFKVTARPIAVFRQRHTEQVFVIKVHLVLHSYEEWLNDKTIKGE